jgi:hypothetical protein
LLFDEYERDSIMVKSAYVMIVADIFDWQSWDDDYWTSAGDVSPESILKIRRPLGLVF